jgi:hypothetical protein
MRQTPAMVFDQCELGCGGRLELVDEGLGEFEEAGRGFLGEDNRIGEEAMAKSVAGGRRARGLGRSVT